MISSSIALLYIFFQPPNQPPSSSEGVYIGAVVAVTVALLSTIGNIVQFKMGRKKSGSEESNLDAQTLKTYVDIIREIQTTNSDLYNTMVMLRDRAEKVEDDLEECRKEAKGCEKCRECLTGVINALREFQPFLATIDSADESVKKIRIISRDLLQTVEVQQGG